MIELQLDLHEINTDIQYTLLSTNTETCIVYKDSVMLPILTSKWYVRYHIRRMRKHLAKLHKLTEPLK